VSYKWPFVDGTGEPGDTIVNGDTDDIGAATNFPSR
jgi:hypothetical protein